MNKSQKIINLFFTERTSGEIFNPSKNKWIQINPENYKDELEDEFYKLIDTAYKPIGGFANIKTPKDVFSPDVDFWQGIDLHGDSDFDLIIFGKKTSFGIKSVGVGHDATKEATKEYLNHIGYTLSQMGNYIEASGKLAEILMNKYNIPVVTDKELIKKILKKDIEFTGINLDEPNSSGNGWYTRVLGGHRHYKILLGKPKT